MDPDVLLLPTSIWYLRYDQKALIFRSRPPEFSRQVKERLRAAPENPVQPSFGSGPPPPHPQMVSGSELILK
jgi:hypothetical protein